MKSNAERMVEAFTWAAVVIWLGFVLIAHILDYVFLVIMVLGVIFLSSAIYQRSRGWHTSLGIWVFGIWMAVFSVLETVSMLVGAGSSSEGLNIDLWVYLGVALLSMGIAAVLRSVNSGALLGTTPETGDVGGASPYIPGQLQDDLSSGWTDPYPNQGYGHQTGAYGQAQGRPGAGAFNGQTGFDQGWGAPPPEQPTYHTGYSQGWQQPGQQTNYTQGWDQNQWRSNQWQQSQWQQPQQPQQPQSGYDQGWQQPTGQQPAGGFEAGWNEWNPSNQEQPHQQGGDYHSSWGDQSAYNQQTDYAPWDQQPQQPAAPRPSERPLRRPRQQPQAGPDDLEARIEDIIRRSRERRAGSSDENPPY